MTDIFHYLPTEACGDVGWLLGGCQCCIANGYQLLLQSLTLSKLDTCRLGRRSMAMGSWWAPFLRDHLNLVRRRCWKATLTKISETKWEESLPHREATIFDLTPDGSIIHHYSYRRVQANSIMCWKDIPYEQIVNKSSGMSTGWWNLRLQKARNNNNYTMNE